MHRLLTIASLALGMASATAADIRVTTFSHTGPAAMPRPVMLDTVDLNGARFEPQTLLDAPADLSRAAHGRPYDLATAPTADVCAMHLLHFALESSGYAEAGISLGAMENARLYVDGRQTESGATSRLAPGRHDVVIKYISVPGRTDSLSVSVTADERSGLHLADPASPRAMTITDVMTGRRIYGVDISADGRYAICTTYHTDTDGTTSWRWLLTELKTGRTLLETSDNISWMPTSTAYRTTRTRADGRLIELTDPATGITRTLASHLPEGDIRIAPNERFGILTRTDEGPADDTDVRQIVDPDDRMPGWRCRTSLHLVDFEGGTVRPLTFGYHNASLFDISADGRHIIFGTERRRLTARPTTLFSIMRLDLETMAVDTLVADDGFVSGALLSPDGRSVLIEGSPECLGGVGLNLPQGRTPNMFDHQLYLLDIATRAVRPLTRDFAPSVSRCRWSRHDGQIYFTADDRDYIRLFRANPATGRIERIGTPEDIVSTFALAAGAPAAVWFGKSASNSDRAYRLDARSLRSQVLLDVSAERLKGIGLGRCIDWNFASQRGDTICGRYYLPPAFEPDSVYPLIVYYYGGCSPTARGFETHYPPHVYAAQGYVVYVINPSGAVGFGQEFASRHVATAGRGVADDIIEGTRLFAAGHPFVDSRRIGCIGASYGGFMTQYLQTQTDLFAAAVSHAGISDHTSYWGEGYWGYSYSEVSMAGRYPWSDRELYVDQSPLFNADRIHTPILFLHGTDDTNVPTAESHQIYTALRLLGREAALIEVEGQNHHITDFGKRLKWQNSIFAWFARWLKGDDTWWNALYEPRNL